MTLFRFIPVIRPAKNVIFFQGVCEILLRFRTKNAENRVILLISHRFRMCEPIFAQCACEHNNPDLDDSARPHRTNPVIEWHNINKIEKISWPGNSPDLNPIENMWTLPKTKLRLKSIRNKAELISNAIKIWNHEMPIELARSLADSMPNRIKKCLGNNGNSTKY